MEIVGYLSVIDFMSSTMKKSYLETPSASERTEEGLGVFKQLRLTF